MGYSLFSVRNLAVQYHLYHKENWTDQSENQHIMEEKKTLQKFVCDSGLQKRGALNGTPSPGHSSGDQNRKKAAVDKVLLLEFKYHQETIPSHKVKDIVDEAKLNSYQRS